MQARHMVGSRRHLHRLQGEGAGVSEEGRQRPWRTLRDTTRSFDFLAPRLNIDQTLRVRVHFPSNYESTTLTTAHDNKTW